MRAGPSSRPSRARAIKAARWERQSRAAQQLDLLAQERLELLALAGRTVPYSRGFREVRTGRVQGGQLVMEARPMPHVTERTRLDLILAADNLLHLGSLIVEDDTRGRTLRALARHVERDLRRIAGEIDAELDDRARVALDMAEERFALTVAGVLALRAAEG